MKGSKYEIIYDNSGAPRNQKDIEAILKKKYTIENSLTSATNKGR